MFQLKMLGMKKARKEAEKGVAIDYDLDKVERLHRYIAV